MRQVIKQDLHIGHNGVEGSLRRAQKYVFWPGMNKEINQWIECCETCWKNEVAQASLPLMSHDMPQRPWEKIGIDLFYFSGKEYLITVCYRSTFGRWIDCTKQPPNPSSASENTTPADMAYQMSWSVTTDHHSLHKTLTISPDSGESNTPPLLHTTAKPMEKWNLQ